jgi:hypothetical protein
MSFVTSCIIHRTSAPLAGCGSRALRPGSVPYNLYVLFQRHLGCLDRVTAATTRFQLFTTVGIISRSGGRTTIRLAVSAEQRDWWRMLFERLFSPWPNCDLFRPNW